MSLLISRKVVEKIVKKKMPTYHFPEKGSRV